MAVDRVERRLRAVAAALDTAGVLYAIIGGNAVAAWVSRADPGATRATKDVDILVRRADTGRVTAVLTGMGFQRLDIGGPVCFVDPDEPSRKSGLQLVWAGEKVWPSNLFPTPDVSASERSPDGFTIVALPALVRMKLTSFRDIDRVHIADMLSVGLIGPEVRAALPPELLARLIEIEKANPEV